MTERRALRAAAFLTWALALLYPQAFVWGAYPDRPVRLIVPSPPGGGNDIMARLAGLKLTEAWGKQVVVDNRPGAGGALAAGRRDERHDRTGEKGVAKDLRAEQVHRGPPGRASSPGTFPVPATRRLPLRRRTST